MSRVMFTLGTMLRETGQVLDRIGCSMQGSNAFREAISKHRTVAGIYDKVPALPAAGFVAPSASVIGGSGAAGGRGSRVDPPCALGCGLVSRSAMLPITWEDASGEELDEDVEARRDDRHGATRGAPGRRRTRVSWYIPLCRV